MPKQRTPMPRGHGAVLSPTAQVCLQVTTVGTPVPNTCCGSIPLKRFPLSSPQSSGVALPPRAYRVIDWVAKSLALLTRASRVVCLACPEALAQRDRCGCVLREKLRIQNELIHRAGKSLR